MSESYGWRFQDYRQPNEGSIFGIENSTNFTRVRCPVCGLLNYVPRGHQDATHNCTIICPYSGDQMWPYNVTIVGISPSIAHNATLLLLADGDFFILSYPGPSTPLVVEPGQCGTYALTVEPVGNFTIPVGLTLINVPVQIDWQFFPNGTTSFPSEQLPAQIIAYYGPRVCVRNGTPPGNYTLTVLGKSIPPQLSHTTQIRLMIPLSSVSEFPSPFIPLIGLTIGLTVCLFVVSKSRRRKY